MKERRNALMPYQTWQPFPGDAIVLAINAYGDRTIEMAKNLWWGYEEDMGSVAEGVIVKAKRLDAPNPKM